MKQIPGILTTVTLCAAIFLTGCDSSSNKMDEAETAVIEANRDLEIATSEVVAELRIYREKNADRIMEYNRAISDIKKKINNESKSDIKARYETKLDGFEATHRDLKREMDNYEASGKENWDDFKVNFSNKMDDLGDSLNDFFAAANTTN
ncbi:hypothetical protein [Rhodohalobacter sp. 8-1]|uniref:hypothetical protein n=1 Tax=Rhodohalobacter sp. 8-1 TaxID=3131972 RepID=UPI0030EC8F63